jgi:hypothetical protein
MYPPKAAMSFKHDGPKSAQILTCDEGDLLDKHHPWVRCSGSGGCRSSSTWLLGLLLTTTQGVQICTFKAVLCTLPVSRSQYFGGKNQGWGIRVEMEAGDSSVVGKGKAGQVKSESDARQKKSQPRKKKRRWRVTHMHVLSSPPLFLGWHKILRPLQKQHTRKSFFCNSFFPCFPWQGPSGESPWGTD